MYEYNYVHILYVIAVRGENIAKFQKFIKTLSNFRNIFTNFCIQHSIFTIGFLKKIYKTLQTSCKAFFSILQNLQAVQAFRKILQTFVNFELIFWKFATFGKNWKNEFFLIQKHWTQNLHCYKSSLLPLNEYGSKSGTKRYKLMHRLFALDIYYI